MNNATSNPSLRLKPLVACLAIAMAVGAASSTSIHAAPGAASPRAHLVKRTGDGFLRVQAAKSEQAHSRRAAVPARPAATIAVTSCADDGSAGTLRAVVASAVDGDTVDLTALACSTITLLEQGKGGSSIVIGVNNLSITGPGAAALTIDANATSTAFDFPGAEEGGYGTLAIQGVTITNGNYYGAGGGVIWAGNGGNVSLVSSVISNSSSEGKYASGGCVFADGSVTLTNSTVTNCTADSSKYDGVGGGVYAAGDVSIVNSTISGNVAKSNGSYYYSADYDPTGSGLGGGAAAGGLMTITNSTLSGNSASYGGAVFSNNIVSIQNSTITANTAVVANSSGTFGAQGGGVVIDQAQPTAGNAPAGTGNTLNSTIVFGNTGGGVTFGADFGGTVTISGANNLVGASTTTMPAGTLTSNPLLGPLANNGGPTLTHAIAAGSPAANAGNNVAGLATDQRGAGFARVSAASADIGSFEIQGAPPAPYQYVPVPALSTWAMGALAALLGLVGWRTGAFDRRRRRHQE